ncbi:hypothetical protein QBC35DRAFT_464933 [Podospora australis]|uniref:DUF6594 domain-containing protein n=1 Tax=Podospora australis TaxID=1536484 RepID=A0AAN6WTL2_9PEZI|nr:hypothetical protein QBC35DRAFT_464933 [Podospora australis]
MSDNTPPDGDMKLTPQDLTLAAAMAANNNIAIFRRFDDLNLLNLSVLQHEVHTAHKHFRSLAYQEQKQLGMVDWNTVLKSEEVKKLLPELTLVWKTLAEKLSRYNEALVEVAQLRRLEPPSEEDIARLREEVQRSSVDFDEPGYWDERYNKNLLTMKHGPLHVSSAVVLANRPSVIHLTTKGMWDFDHGIPGLFLFLGLLFVILAVVASQLGDLVRPVKEELQNRCVGLSLGQVLDGAGQGRH